MRYTTASTAASRSGRRWSGGTRNGMPAALILRFARTRRCAIVASGTRNARDLLGGEAAERAQREGDLRLGAQRRMAASEEQLEPLVGDLRRVVHGVVGNRGRARQ